MIFVSPRKGWLDRESVSKIGKFIEESGAGKKITLYIPPEREDTLLIPISDKSKRMLIGSIQNTKNVLVFSDFTQFLKGAKGIAEVHGVLAVAYPPSLVDYIILSKERSEANWKKKGTKEKWKELDEARKKLYKEIAELHVLEIHGIEVIVLWDLFRREVNGKKTQKPYLYAKLRPFGRFKSF